MGYITSAVSARVGQYVTSVLSVPTVTNAHLNTFLNTTTVPLPALSFNQGLAIRDDLLSFLVATVSGAALLLLDRDMELYMGMGDGMVVGAHAFVDVLDQRQVTVSYADAGTGGDLVTVGLFPNGSRNASSEVRRTFFDVHKTAWFSAARPGAPRWSPLIFASARNALGSLPYIISQTQVVEGVGPGNQSLVLASTLYVTPDKYQQRFKSDAYNFTAYVVEGSSLDDSKLILASAGTVNNCNVDGAVALSADDSEEPTVAQVALTLNSYTLQMNASQPCTEEDFCVRPKEPLVVGIGVARTQVGAR